MEQDPKTPEKTEGTENPEGQPPTAVADSEAAAEEKEEKKVVPFEVVAREEKEDSTAELTLHIPYEEYDRELNELFEELRTGVQVPGFRKGKAPLKLIRARFQKDAQKDAIGKLVPSCVEQLVEKESLRLLGEPTLIEEATKIEEAKHVEVKIELEMFPKFELQSYKGLDVEIHSHEITDQLVDDQLEQIRKSNAAYEAKAGDQFEEEDALVVDIRVEDEKGQAVGNLSREDLFLRTPKSALPEPVYKAIVGKKRGDVAEVTVDFERKNRVGEVLSKTDQYHVTLKEIKTAKLPKLDDEFAKDLGDFKDLKGLRDHIRADLERQEENRQRDEAIGRIHGKLVDLNPIRAPKTLVAAQQLDQLQGDSQMFRQM
ncbi:MAG: trigger factor, partial [bacterium]